MKPFPTIVAITLCTATMAATPAAAACTFWPGRDNRAAENCMELERQKIELRRIESEQRLQQELLRQQLQRQSRPQNCIIEMGSKRCS